MLSLFVNAMSRCGATRRRIRYECDPLPDQLRKGFCVDDEVSDALPNSNPLLCKLVGAPSPLPSTHTLVDPGSAGHGKGRLADRVRPCPRRGRRVPGRLPPGSMVAGCWPSRTRSAPAGNGVSLPLALPLRSLPGSVV